MKWFITANANLPTSELQRHIRIETLHEPINRICHGITRKNPDKIISSRRHRHHLQEGE